jgi:hypothetical protein
VQDPLLTATPPSLADPTTRLDPRPAASTPRPFLDRIPSDRLRTSADAVRRVLERSERSVRVGHRALAIEGSLLLAYLVLKSLHLDVLLVAWTAAAVLVALAAPASGLVLLAAIAPFNEANVPRELLVRLPLVTAMTISVGVRYALGERPRLPALPLQLAVLLLALTVVGLVVALVNLGADTLRLAVRQWASGLGSGLVILLLAAWVTATRGVRPLVVALAAAWLGGVLSLVDFLDRDLLRSSALGWMFREEGIGERLTGIVPGPNPMATLLLLPGTVLAAAVLFAHASRARLAALLALAPIAAALVFTFSRSAILGAAAAAAMLGLRLRGWLAVVLLVGGLGALLIVAPIYVRERGDAIGRRDESLITAGDVDRAAAWKAAVRMWRAAPVTGQGAGGFARLHERYGEPRADAPHNEWLRLFAEYGAFAGVAGLALAVASLAALTGGGWLVAGISAAIAATWSMAGFNNPLSYMQVTTPVFLVLGSGLALAAAEGRRGFRWRWGRRGPPDPMPGPVGR